MNECKKEKVNKPMVAIIMGSDSDLKIMKVVAFVMEQYDISYEIKVVSAHRTPERMYDYAKNAGILAARILGVKHHDISKKLGNCSG